jgi:hypothetical protein
MMLDLEEQAKAYRVQVESAKNETSKKSMIQIAKSLGMQLKATSEEAA